MNTQYIDITWLTTFGLGPNNVLEYFYTSPFYDPNTNNETFRIQGIPSYVMIAQLTNGKTTGMEYEVDNALSKDPHLFVIKKQNRNKNIVDVIEMFYCLDGIIFQSPFVLDVLRTRISKISHHLHKSFEALNEHVEHMTSGGHLLTDDSSQKRKDAAEVCRTDTGDNTETMSVVSRSERSVGDGRLKTTNISNKRPKVSMDFKLLYEDLKVSES